jgi:hypothetical protein
VWLGAGVAMIFGLGAFALVWSWRRVRSGTPSSAFAAVPALLACVAMPFALPAFEPGIWALARIAVSVAAVTTTAKVWTSSRAGPRDPAMLASFGRFALWFIMPPETTWPADAAVAARNRAEGSRRLGRALAKLPGFGALYVLHVYVPTVHDVAHVEAFWALWLCWLGISAIVDVVTGTAMLAGVHVEEIFDAPPLARSPRDFWGKRWNLFVHQFAARFLFIPLGGRHHPIRATLGVFACSGAMHEYFVLATTGGVGAHTGHTGWMMAFFILQGLAVVAEMIMRRRSRRARLPRAAAIALHVVWLTATGPLFFAPLGDIFVGW